MLTDDARIKIPLKDIQDVSTSKVLRPRAWGMALQIRASSGQKFEFGSSKKRDNTVQEIKARLNASRDDQSGRTDDQEESAASTESSSAAPAKATGSDEKQNNAIAHTSQVIASKNPLPAFVVSSDLQFPPLAINLWPAIVNVPESSYHIEPRHFVCMAIGSRGDVQPYGEYRW